MRFFSLLFLSAWNPVKSCGEYCDGEDDTFTLASNNNNNNVGCSSNPCQNSCTCEVSCQDENDYVCVPPAGRPFVGKNCEWEAIVQCTANRSIRVSIPTGAVAQYAQGVENVVLQGCNQAANNYICETPSCGPVETPTNGFFTLECASNAFTTSNGQYSFGQTIVFDRKSSLVSMPHPIVRVECNMQTRPASSIIDPMIRGPSTMTQTIFWQPIFNFYKTRWGLPMILANDGNRLPNGAVGYIIGERIHVRITATLNGVPAANLPVKHQMSIQSCQITPAGGDPNGVLGGGAIQIISGGAAVSGTPFPISVDHEPGMLGGGMAPAAEGVGFSFQVFTFGSGTNLQLTCYVNINGARRKRDSDEESEEDLQIEKMISVNLLIFEKAENSVNDIPTLAMQQEPEEEIIYRDISEMPPYGNTNVAVNVHPFNSIFILGSFAGVVIFGLLIVGAAILRRRYRGGLIL